MKSQKTKIVSIKATKLFSYLERVGFKEQRNNGHIIFSHSDGRRISVAVKGRLISKNNALAIIREGKLDRCAFIEGTS